MRFIYHREASAEINTAARHYETKAQGLGASFIAELDDAVASLRMYPLKYPIVEQDVRRRSLHHYPYAIYFRIEGEVIRVLSVKHHRRHPDYWKHRLQK